MFASNLLKKAAALTLGLMLALPMAAGAETTLDYEAIEKPESISWCSHDGMLPENGQVEWDAEYERLTGIKL